MSVTTELRTLIRLRKKVLGLKAIFYDATRKASEDVGSYEELENGVNILITLLVDSAVKYIDEEIERIGNEAT